MTVLTIQPSTKDARIVKGIEANSNFSSEATTCLRSDPNGTQRILLAIPASSIPAGAVISAASLSIFLWFYYYGVGSPGPNILCQRCTQAWDEATVTWNTQPTVTATDEASAILPAGGNWMSFDVLALTRDAILNRSNLLSVLIRFQNETLPDSVPIFISREYADPLFRPKLVVTYTLPVVETHKAKILSNSAIPTSAEVGDEIDITVTIRNDGNVSDLMQAWVEENNVTFIEVAPTPFQSTLSPGATAQFTLRFIMPNHQVQFKLNASHWSSVWIRDDVSVLVIVTVQQLPVEQTNIAPVLAGGFLVCLLIVAAKSDKNRVKK